MTNEYDGDLIFSVIKQHLYDGGDLDPLKIQSALISEKITVDLGVVNNRIDEFKKSRAYKDYKPKNPNQ